MATFKELAPSDFRTARSFVERVVDIIQEDISGSISRQHYQVFVTGGIGPGVTSSLFQTVYDHDFSLQTANPQLDMTVGLYVSSSIVTSTQVGTDIAGKPLFPSTTLMMREKVHMYQLHAQKLLGDANAQFVAPFGSTTTSDKIDAALFIDLKRLFVRDGIKRETFVMNFFQTASLTGENLVKNDPPQAGYALYTDVGAATNKEVTFGGAVSNIVNAADTSQTVGLLFNDAGVVVLDLKKALDSTQVISGTIDAVTPTGTTVISASFIPDFVVSASIDDIVDHIASVRFGSGTLTAMTFQSLTTVNSLRITARLAADEFNYSSNPTYTDADDRIVVIDQGQEETQKPFTMITTIGLYDANNVLLGVAKLSRPVEKNDERDITFTLRLDF